MSSSVSISHTSNPLVSIIIPTFNRAELIKETLQSVQNQTYQDWECIVIDDGSTDNTKEEVHKFVNGDCRFKLLLNQRKKGAPGARNTGIEIAKGDYFIFLDSDDLLAANCLFDRINKFKENPENDFLVFSTMVFEKEINDSGILINVFTNNDVLERFLNLDVPWLTTGPIWKKKSFIKLGLWNEELLSWQDWELHIRAILKNFKYKYFSTVDNFWRSNKENESISKVSISSAHLSSHLKLIEELKEQIMGKPNYTSRLNGLAYWIGEQALAEGNIGIAKKAIEISHKDLHFGKKMINQAGLSLFKRLFIKHPQIPDFGTIRRVQACIYQNEV